MRQISSPQEVHVKTCPGICVFDGCLLLVDVVVFLLKTTKKTFSSTPGRLKSFNHSFHKSYCHSDLNIRQLCIPSNKHSLLKKHLPPVPLQHDIRQLKKPRQRRWGQRRLKNELIFYLQISRYPKVIYYVYLCQSYHETESRTHRYIRNKIQKISRRGSRSPGNTELGRFTFLFLEDGKEMYREL